MSITGKKAGTATITITASDVGDTSENEVTGSKTIKITVKENSPQETTTPSSGTNTNTNTKATLTKLVVAGKTYNKPAKSITVKVDNDVTSAKIVPTTSNGESFTIDKGSNVKLEEGTNTVKITLASGNVYTVYIRRAAKVDETPNIIDEPAKEEEPIKVMLKSLLVKGVIQTEEGEEKVPLSYTPEFSGEIYEYKIVLDETLSDITKLDIEAIGEQEDFTIDITGNEEIVEGENLVTITVKSKDGQNSATYKILVTKEEKVMPISAPIVEEEQPQKEPLWNTAQTIFIVAFTAVTAILGIIFAVVEYRYGKKKEASQVGKIPFSQIDMTPENTNTDANMSTNKEDTLEEFFASAQEEKEEKSVRKRKEDKLEEDVTTRQEKPKRGKHF